jgi:hypothetical protein
MSLAQADGALRFGLAEVENRSESHVEAMELAGQEVIRRQSLPPSQAVELIGNRLDVQAKVKSGEAVGRVPPAAMDARTRSGTRIRTYGDVSERNCLESRRAQCIDSGDELLHDTC